MSAADRAHDFGSRLRDARERKGVSLRQIATQTKISVSVLEALERSDISRLPGGIFSRAFVRSYAAAVGLDPETTIQEFMAQFPTDSVTAGHPTSARSDDDGGYESNRRIAATLLWILAFSAAIAAVVAYFAMTRSAASPAEAPTFVSAPAGERVAGPVARPAGAAGAVRLETPPAGEPAPDRLTIGLAARRTVWVSATVDGRKALERLLQAGQQETLEFSREMALTVGDASALDMTVNGEETLALGDAGEIVTTRVTPANYRGFLKAR